MPARASGRVGFSSQLRAAIVEQARRGLRLQVLLRGVLAAFALLTVAIVSPGRNATACYVVAGAYAAWSASIAGWGWRGGARAQRLVWVALLVDLAALGTLTVLAGASARETWTADVLINGFVLVPVLASTQLTPRLGAAIVAPTIGVYLAVSIATRSANDGEPWSSIALRTGVLVGVSLGCVALSWIQRARVLTIGGLLEDRTDLLGQVMSAEDRERRALAEHLHDGALQYLLGARHDLKDAQEDGDPEAFARLELALTESSRLLRSTVAELHPAVLEHAGLARALRQLADAAATGGPAITVELEGWSDELRTPVDALLYSAARELLSNVVKHAGASSATIALTHERDRASLAVADDGRGIDERDAELSLGMGHIGLASQRARIEAAGGTLTVSRRHGSGTTALVELPCTPPRA